MEARKEKIGLFGGSFDPVHTGHLILAQAAANVAGLARVIFIPTAVPPHKRDVPLTDIETRARMVALAIDGNPRFELSRIETAEGVSYTYRTVRAFAERGYGREDLHLLVGGDMLAEMAEWREPGEIFARATVIAMPRPGHERLPALPPEAAIICMTEGINGISSRAIRALVREGKPIRHLVPEAVERFIAEYSLYAPGI